MLLTLTKSMLVKHNRFHLLTIHGLRTPREEIVFTARPKIQSHSQIFRYGRSIFCLPHRPKFSDFYDLCLHWVSVVRAPNHFHLLSFAVLTHGIVIHLQAVHSVLAHHKCSVKNIGTIY